MYCFLLYVYLYNWDAYLGQDTPGKEIFNRWLNKGKYISKDELKNIILINIQSVLGLMHHLYLMTFSK